jgi:hypothetical protein
MNAIHLYCYEAKQPNLKLKTQHTPLLSSLLLAFALPIKTTGILCCVSIYNCKILAVGMLYTCIAIKQNSLT